VTRRYHAHGLLVDSDVELPLTAACADRPGPPDLTLRRGADRPVPPGDPDGEPVARLADPAGRTFYSIATDGSRTVLRYPGLCEFVGDGGLRDVQVHLHPGREPGLIPVLAAGNLLAVHLRLRGELVLHASAVRIGSCAIAFVGGSGMGKSTMATLLCAGGHPLLTDDVLRTQLLLDTVLVHPGSTETRLRDAARPLAAALSGAGRATADGRLAVRPTIHTGPPLRLAACVVPQPDRAQTGVTAHRLTGSRALLLLARFPRVLGWTEPLALARDFQLLADLVERVPVFCAQVPWGPPFPADLAAELLAALGSSLDP
jgi:hypothetical protein